MNQADVAAEYRRLEILQLLKADPDYRMNDALLKELLRLSGHAVSQAELHGDLEWLKRVGAIATQSLPGCVIAILRSEGMDAAEGTIHIPGIAHPRPE